MVTAPSRPSLGDGPPRAAAVLLLLYPAPDGGDTIVLTRRTEHLPTHAGQIALPGGAVDPTDRDPVAAALREAEEELGIRPDLVTVTGTLAPVFTVVSNYLITPVIGRATRRPPFRPNPAEVAEVIEVALAELRDPRIYRRERRETPRGALDVHFFQYGAYTIWGATARILQLFLENGAPDC